MADNVTYQSGTPASPPSGDVIAATDIGGVKYQHIILYGKTGDTTYQAIRVDPTTHVLLTEDYAHGELHGENHYYIEGYTELDDTDVLRVKLVTPDTAKLAHFRWAIASSGICESTLHLDASGGMTGGSGVTPINNDHNSSNTSGVTITSGVTVADTAGTLVSNAKWGSGFAKQTYGGGTSRDDEIKLKRNAIYLRTFTSGSDNNIIQFAAAWYEHTDNTA